MTHFGLEEPVIKRTRKRVSEVTKASRLTPIEQYVLAQAKKWAREWIKSYLRSKMRGKMTDKMRWKKIGHIEEEVSVTMCATLEEVQDLMSNFGVVEEMNQQLAHWYTNAYERFAGQLEKQQEKYNENLADSDTDITDEIGSQLDRIDKSERKDLLEEGYKKLKV